MADYGSQQGRNYRPNNYGHSSNYQRDAAFSSIFGAAPPPGRTQTMTSQTTAHPSMIQDHTQMMTSQGSDGMHRQIPQRPAAGGYAPRPGGSPNGQYQNM